MWPTAIHACCLLHGRSSWPGRRFSRKLSSSIYIDNTIRKLMPLLQQLHSTVKENNTGICNESPIKMRLSMHHVAIIIGYGNSVEIMCHHEKVHFADLHLPKNSENAFSVWQKHVSIILFLYCKLIAADCFAT